MNVLITGGTGFIGKNLSSFLLKKGLRPAVLARHKNDPDIQVPDFIQCDILDPAGLNAALKDKDIVYHLAAAVDERLSYDNLYRINVIGTKNVLEACSKNNIKHLIFTSTIGVIGPTGPNPAKEDSPYNPQTPYEKTKTLAEQMALDYHKRFNLPVTILRPTMVYGPDERWLKVFKQAKKGMPVIGKGENFWHLVYVKDVVSALYLVMNKENTFGRVYNIADNSPRTYKETYDTFRSCLGLSPVKSHIPVCAANALAFFNELYAKISGKNPIITRPHIKRLIRQRIIDTSKAKQDFSFMPYYSIREGFKETLGSFKDKGLL
jgi:nucleoside-diphosphate-sugar epimerase